MKTPSLLFPFLYGTASAVLESYDYIVVGAGTAGLVVANRLSENPKVTVLVIEAGVDQRNNANVTDWRNFSSPFGTPIDWSYKTVPQTGVQGKSFDLHQGKAWGGTSTINGMTYIRGDKAQIDSWEELGNPGWNWESLFPKYKKSENFTIPSATQLAAGARYQAQYHGFDGPLHVGYNRELASSSTSPIVIHTFKNLGLPHNSDLSSGSTRGFGMGPQTMDRTLDKRWDSATAYYHPIEKRRNIRIIQGTVKRVTWAPKKAKFSKHGDYRVVANGVEYLTDDGASSFVNARKEVVISAGTVRSPGILEGSGIGNPRIINPLGIKTVVDLPGVGENLLEIPFQSLIYNGNLTQTWNAYHSFVTMNDLFGSNVSAIEKYTKAAMPKMAQQIVKAAGKGALKTKAIEKLLNLHHDLLFKKNVTAAEILIVVVTGIFASNFWTLMPFSRGSVHLRSATEINNPLYDPKLSLIEFDFEFLKAAGKLNQKFFMTKPIDDFRGAPIETPGNPTLPDDATEEQWDAYVRGPTFSTGGHPMGTSSMMSRSLGGVVDPELRVYGTANVRVVDASVLPTQFSGHVTATLYAVAERASEIIKKTSW